MKPTFHKASKRWVVQYPPKLSTTGKRQSVYFATEEEAEEDVRSRVGEREEHGKAAVTAQERAMIIMAREVLGDLRELPKVLEHWRKTGDAAVRPRIVDDAVHTYLKTRKSEVTQRTFYKISGNLEGFVRAFEGRAVHSIHAGDLDLWLQSFSAGWTRKTAYAQLSPFFQWCLIHRHVAENPLELIKSPDTRKKLGKLYTPEQFVQMLEWSQANSFDVVLPYLALTGLCFLRTAELIRSYSSEHVLRWSDIKWSRRVVAVPHEVAKQTGRDSEERSIPFGESFERVMTSHIGKIRTGRIVEIFQADFSPIWQRMHDELGFAPIHNGMRRSCISYALAARQDLAVVQCARWCGNSEGTIKKHYRVGLSEEEGRRWFELPVLFY